MVNKLSHVDESGRAKMVDISRKVDTERVAIAKGEVRMRLETLEIIRKGAMKKGDVLTVAQIAGIMAAKRTSDIIPLCHPIPLLEIKVDLELDKDLPGVQITSIVKTMAKTEKIISELRSVRKLTSPSLRTSG
jgi:cyclic pyranopterin phosphate synthase